MKCITEHKRNMAVKPRSILRKLIWRLDAHWSNDLMLLGISMKSKIVHKVIRFLKYRKLASILTQNAVIFKLMYLYKRNLFGKIKP